MDKNSFHIRVTGVLLEDSNILLVKQRISSRRNWSLPGGRAQAGEKLDDAIIREVYEETGFVVTVNKLLYLCDKTDCIPPILHVSFLLDKAGGALTMPTNEFDENPISDVRFVDFSELNNLGFSEKFVELAKNGFPCAGSYMGAKENIGL